MKRAETILLIVVFFTSLAYLGRNSGFPGVCNAALANGSIKYVGPGNYSSIQAAINDASPGDTIDVVGGTYLEHVVVNKSVALISHDRASAIIDGSGSDVVVNITASNVTVSGFTIRGSGGYPSDSGIYIQYSSGNMISNNIVTNNTEGIACYFSNGNLLLNNTVVSNNYIGIHLYSSSNNVISGNNVSLSNYDGINLQNSDNNLISGNIVYGNLYYGIHLSFSSNNAIHHNNFLNSAHQVFSDSTNSWTVSGEGNYWSDYAGRDVNEDGIGDSLYTSGRVIDARPLMGMFSSFSFVQNGQTYDVAFISNSSLSKVKFEIGQETGNRILQFNVSGASGTDGFCRIDVPSGLMTYPFIAVVDNEEDVPKLLNVTGDNSSHIYFSYLQSDHTVSLISSLALTLYSELLANFTALQGNLLNLNALYLSLLSNYDTLLVNYTQLLASYRALNQSFDEQQEDFSAQTKNTRNLTYVFAALSGVFLITTVYLSRRNHIGSPAKPKVPEE